MKNYISLERYEEILNSLENDKHAFRKMTASERREISKDRWAMKIAANTDIRNLRHLNWRLRKDPNYMFNLTNSVNPLACAYCNKKLFANKKFVAAIKRVADNDAKKYNSPKLKSLYNRLVSHQVKKSIANDIQK